MLTPERIANTPPVIAPDIIALNGSSFYQKYISMQSNDEKHPPHIAKEPPSKGALFLTCYNPPIIFVLLGEFQAPMA
jgi:hypothetical protein